MQLDRQIRVNELLLQREELFLRVHAAEAEIVRLLGGPYPFTRPSLPSDRRTRRKPTPSAPRLAARPTLDLLRRLNADENAYRVAYRQFDREHVETHFDLDALATLLATPAAHLHVEKIETLDSTGRPVAVLYPAS